jgi:hypothetical protein
MIGGLTLAATLTVADAQLLPIVEYAGMSSHAAESEASYDISAYDAHALHFLDAFRLSVYSTDEGGYRSWLDALAPMHDGRLGMPSVYPGGLVLVPAAVAAGV